MRSERSKPVALIVMGIGLTLALAGCASDRKAEPNEMPSPPPVSGNQVEHDYAVKTATCLTAKGWDVQVDSVGGWGVVSKVPEEQRAVYNADYEACLNEVGLGDFTVTEETASANYDNNLRVIGCLEDTGYSAEAPPSRATFITQTLEDPSALVWDPYSLVAPDDMGKAVLACPQ